ncbi:FAD-dependent monooxygenase [Vicingaceae bacterium]|nr:FAD-dependent monooxygenase [Vicingaceae bacterium]
MEKIAIVGAGLVGSLQAILLAKKGYHVEVFERRPDMRNVKLIAGRSINLALSDRGWKALKMAGVDDKIKETAIPMYGRMMHAEDGTLTPQAYGKEGQAIYSVSRGGLNQTLMNLADKYDNVNFNFNKACKNVDLENNELTFSDVETKEKTIFSPDRIFGTDGAFSAIRARLQKTSRFNYSQTYLKHGYKELCIPANPDGTHQIDKNSLHIWPRGEYMMIALPNIDGSFTCTLFFPFEGANSFESIKTEQDVLRFFNERFADVVPLMPDLVTEYFENPTSPLVTVKCEPWNYSDKIILMGDASHAIVPFYGQGMNSGFEDCSVFEEMSANFDGNWAKLFEDFANERKPNGDAIADLAIQNFIEMRDKVADESFLLRKKIEKKLFTKYPDKWMPLYSQVTFSHIPYATANAQGKKQEKIMDVIMTEPEIENNWDSNEIEQRILSLI